ncbi:MAG: BspA family leucine-rich repeat surface protein [Aequorivita antarctica]
MKKIVLSLLVLCMFQYASSQTIYYVDAAATGNNNGSSWANAYTQLNRALRTLSPGAEIWVAQGTYYADDAPGITSGDRNASFVIKNGMKIRGGFPTGGGTLQERDWNAHPTIMSGDIGTQGDHSDNTANIILTVNVSNNTLLDGFIVEYGRATITTSQAQRGAAWYNDVDNGATSLPKAINCTFRNNSSITQGGAIYINADNGATAGIYFNNCIFSNNTTTSAVNGFGGAIYSEATNDATVDVEITNSSFLDNEARYGGAISNSSKTGASVFFTVLNSLFDDNSSNSSGGAIRALGTRDGIGGPFTSFNRTRFINCTFSNNETASSSGGAAALFYRTASNSGIYNTIIWGNNPTNNQMSVDQSDAVVFASTVENVVGQNPLFVNPATQNFRLQPGSPAINTGINQYNDQLTDLDGNIRIVGLTVDQGAYESPAGSLPEFITEWKTDHPGSSANNQIILPIFGFLGSAYNYTVAWGDGTSDTFTTGGLGNVTHTYPAPGTYQVRISGSFPRILFNGSGDRQKILKVLNWGNIQWSSMDSAFEGCSNLHIEATDKPDLSNVTSLNEMFRNATSMNDNLNNWDVSTITSMIGTFEGATAFNTNLSNWDVNNVVLTTRMFQDASSFNQPLDMWQTSNLQNTGAMFRRASSFNQDIGSWDVSKVTEFISMFEDATAFNQDVGTWDTGSAETFASMFAGATSFDQDLGSWDVSSLSTAFPDSIDGANNMFAGVTLSTSNYDSLLIGWNTLDAGESGIPNNIPFHGGNSIYCVGTSARADLINTHNWAITDGGTNPPVAVCQNITAFLDASGNVSILATDLDGGSSGACGTISFSASKTDFNCSDLGANTVTLTVTDVASGIFSQCTATVTIEDNTPPTLSCPAAITVNNDIGICEAFVTVPQPIYSDNCSESTIALEFDGTNDYVTAALPALFNDIANTDFTIEMWVKPHSFVTQRLFFAQKEADEFVSILLNSSGQVYLFINNLYSAQAPTAIPLNTWSHIAVVWTAATNNREIFINGDLQATISGGGSTVGANNIMTIGSRSDGTQNFHGQLDEIRIWREARTSGDILNNYQGCVNTSETNLEAYYKFNDGAGSATANDNSGNGHTGTLTNMDINSSWTPGYVNCSEITIVNDYNNTNDASDVYPVGETVITWTATDTSGNSSTCAQTITVNDTEDPIANCAAPFTVQLDVYGNASITVADIENGSTDNCGVASTTIDITNFDCSDVGPNTVTLTVTDVNGNSSTCNTIVTVEDNVAPVANCAAPFTIQLDANGMASITVADIENGSTDNCGIASTSIHVTDFTCAEVGPNTVTLTVTDVNGNSSTCTTIVTVEDNVPPVANCAAPFTIQLDANGMASITVADIENGSTDACGIASTTIDITDFDCSDVGPNTVTLTVTDVNGNVSTCTTVVTVEDSIPPAIACPADITVNTDLGNCSAIVNFPMPIASDNCGVATVTQTIGDPSGSMFPVGATTIEFTATDVNGNTNTCSFIITVIDNEAPVAVCQNITIQLDAAGNASIVAADVDGGSTDQCGVVDISIDVDTFDCSNVGDNNAILTVTDVNGNVSTCTAIVTVEDVTAPVVACQNITVELDPVTGTVTILGTDIDNGSTDACGIASYELDIDTFDCSNIGDNTVVLTVTDVNGNTETCTAIVTVEDNTSPILVCQDFTIEIGADGTATLNPSDVIASNDDACGILTVAVDITEFTCADIGTPITVQVFSQDNNGNLSTCTATVTAVDLLAPVVTCPADQTVDPGAGNLFYIVPDYFTTGEAIAIDNCTDPITIFTQDPVPGTALSDGTYTITLTATDEYGNVGTCDFELTVETTIGVGENEQNLGTITMYPVPAKNILNISNPQHIDLERMEIYDLRGRLVQVSDLRGMGSVKPIDVQLLAAASYYVKIIGKEGQITKRLLKE